MDWELWISLTSQNRFVKHFFTFIAFFSFYSLVSHDTLLAVPKRETHDALHSLFTLGALHSSSPSRTFVSFLTGWAWDAHFLKWLTQCCWFEFIKLFGDFTTDIFYAERFVAD